MMENIFHVASSKDCTYIKQLRTTKDADVKQLHVFMCTALPSFNGNSMIHETASPLEELLF
jgi:hypothetical protein